MNQGRHGTGRPGNREGFYREVFQTINDAVFVYRVAADGSPGRFVEVNDVACRRLGYPREELLGMTPADIADPNLHSRLAAFRELLMAKGSARFETVHVARDGSRIPVESNVRLFEHGGQPAALSISRDITERKRAEAILKENRDRFEAILSNIECITYRCELDRDWTMNYISPHVDRLTGYPPEDFIDNAVRSFESIIHRDDTGPVCRIVNEAAESGGPWEIEYRIRHRDGRHLWVYEKGHGVTDADGRVAYLYGFIINITERKLAEEERQAALQQLQRIVEFLPDATFVIDRDRRVVAWNRAMEAMTGVGQETMIGQDRRAYSVALYGRPGQLLIDRISDPDTRIVPDYDFVRREDGRLMGEVYLPSIYGGRGGHVLAAAAQLLDGDGAVIGAIETIRDITERKMAEKALQDRKAELSSIFRAAPVGIGVVVDRAFSQVNDRLCEMVGYSRDALLGQSARCLYPDDEAYRYVGEEKYEQIRRRGTGTVETRWRRKNGELIDVLLSSTPMDAVDLTAGVTFTALDITDRKRIETALSESEGQKNLILNATNEMVAYYDLGLRVIWANRAAGASVGQSSEDLVGRRCHEIWNDSPTPCPDCPVLRARETRTPQEGERQTPDGRSWAVRGYPVFNEAGDVVALVEFGLDITAHKRGEEEKARLKDQFHQAQRLESVGRLAGGVAHDLNNLLSPILGYGEMLLEDTAKGDDSARESLEEIVSAGLRARNLVRQLLAFSRKQTLAFKTVNLNQLLENFRKLLRRTIREDIAIHWILPPSLPSIQGDGGQLEQVLMNLAVNAQDAMPDGGELTVKTASVAVDADDAEALDGIEPGAYVMLSVGDTGAGMDPDTRKHLFDPFFTTKSPDKGTGLGLATVYGIVKQHKGNIQAESEPGAGSTFKVYLPVGEGKEFKASPETARTVSTGGRETILLVEDNEPVRRLAMTILKRRGYAVLAAAGGEEALALAGDLDGPLDLLLTDVVMPEMNGRQIYEQVAAIWPKVRVLFMSGYSDDVIAHRGVMEPGLDYIQKPFSNKALAAKVREVLDR